jgi:hypothetical protein
MNIENKIMLLAWVDAAQYAPSDKSLRDAKRHLVLE